MNTLMALSNICHQLPDKDGILSAYEASRFQATTPLGNSVADLGCEPILHMRHFQVCSHPRLIFILFSGFIFYDAEIVFFLIDLQKHRSLPDLLVSQVLQQSGNS